MRKIGLILILGLIVSNCSIEKRHYTKGYYVEWNSKHKIAKNNTTTVNEVEEVKLVSKTIVKSEEVNFNSEKPSKEIITALNDDKKSTEENSLNNSLIISLVEKQKLDKLLTDDPEYYPEENKEAKTDINAILSLVFAICGFFFLPVIGSILAIIFGIISLNKINKSVVPLNGRGMAIAGIIVGGLGLILLGLLIYILFALA